MTIRLRLALLYALVFGLSLLASDLLGYLGLERYLATELDRSLASQGDEVAGTTRVQASLTPAGRVFSVELPDLDVFASPGLYVQVVNRAGQLQARSANLGQARIPSTSEALAAALSGADRFETLAVESTRLRIYDRPLRLGADVIGVLQLARSRRDLDTTLGQLRLTSLGIGLASLLLASLAGWWLAGTALRPIDGLTRAARAIGRSRDFARRVATSGPADETTRLATTFNEMLASLEAAHAELEQALASEQRFVADASHELRTPLATIRANLELLRRVEDLSESDRQAALSDALAEVERLGRLVADLLTLARADAGHHLNRQPLKLDDLLRDVYRQARLLALPRDIRVMLADPPEAWAEASPDGLRQLFLILFDNALKYSPERGEVRLALISDGSTARLTVSDDGPGIAPDDAPHVFERFYQANRARSTGGTGLGLAIARWIADEHAACLTFETHLPGGTTFTLDLKTIDPPHQVP